MTGWVTAVGTCLIESRRALITWPAGRDRSHRPIGPSSSARTVESLPRRRWRHLHIFFHGERWNRWIVSANCRREIFHTMIFRTFGNREDHAAQWRASIGLSLQPPGRPAARPACGITSRMIRLRVEVAQPMVTDRAGTPSIDSAGRVGCRMIEPAGGLGYSSANFWTTGGSASARPPADPAACGDRQDQA